MRGSLETMNQTLQTLLNATRVTGLEASANGRVVATVQQLDADGTGWQSQIVELPKGSTQPRTLTRHEKGASSPVLDARGRLFYMASNPEGAKAGSCIWHLPQASASPLLLGSRPGGFRSLQVSKSTLFAQAGMHSQASTEAEHAEYSRSRTTMHVSGILHSAFPSRYWASDLGPATDVILVAELPENIEAAASEHEKNARLKKAAEAASKDAVSKDTAGEDSEADSKGNDTSENNDAAEGADSLLSWRVVRMPKGRLLSWKAAPDASFILAAIEVNVADLITGTQLWRIDVATGEKTMLTDVDTVPGHHLSLVDISPDSAKVVLNCARDWTPQQSLRSTSHIMDIAAGERTELWPELDHWVAPIWVTNSELAATSDDAGSGSVWFGSATDAAPQRIAGGPGTGEVFTGLARVGAADRSVSGDEAHALISLRNGISVAPHPVRIGLPSDAGAAEDTAEVTVEELANPADATDQPGRTENITATAEDGTEIRAWLRLPEGSGPHPLVVFAHGGPWGSWNAFTYRWNPAPFVAAGFAVLLPDPAISTGYGQAMIDRGQQQLGGTPYTDIMALTDATIQRADIDETKQAFAGGSYGGFMANWVAGHTGDRFKAIVTHASLWNTTSMGRSTDNASWDRAMREQGAEYSPHLFAEKITAPMLVIHGDKDYRVPIGQGLELWHALHVHASTPRAADGSLPHRYLYFPDEGHWIESRGNAEVWYRTFIGFLQEHVLGEGPEKPLSLG